MFSSQIARQLARTARAQAPRAAFRTAQPAVTSVRRFTAAPARFDRNSDDVDAATTAGEPGESGDHEGQYARTREDIKVEYPEEDDLPPSKPVVGRGGEHSKRTLATFSMEGKTAVVTGGARGLGLVMAQALVISGADVALVDMNRDEATRSAQGLIDSFKKENPNSKKCVPKYTPPKSPIKKVLAGFPRSQHISATYRVLLRSTSLSQKSSRNTERLIISSLPQDSPRTTMLFLTPTTECRSYGVSMLMVPTYTRSL